MALTKREERTPDVLDRFLARWPEWIRHPMLAWPEDMTDLLRVDEYRENGTLVIRAEMAGIDPDKDVEISVTDGILHIAAERREEEKTEGKAYRRRELRYGSFSRDLPLPDGSSETDVKASYKDGILEVRVPVGATEPPRPATKIPVTKA